MFNEKYQCLSTKSSLVQSFYDSWSQLKGTQNSNKTKETIHNWQTLKGYWVLMCQIFHMKHIKVLAENSLQWNEHAKTVSAAVAVWHCQLIHSFYTNKQTREQCHRRAKCFWTDQILYFALLISCLDWNQRESSKLMKTIHRAFVQAHEIFV